MIKRSFSSVFSRSPGGIVCLLTGVLLGCISIFVDSTQVRYSFVWTMSSVAWSSIIFWPLLLGVGAVIGVRFGKSGAQQLVAAFPQKLLWKLHLRSAILIGAWAATGMLVASIIGVIVALNHGSPFSWQALWPLPILLLGSMMWPIVGYGIGLAVIQWWVGPLLAFGMYGLAAFGVVNFSNVFSFAGHASDWVVMQSGQMGVMVATAGMLFALLLGSTWLIWAVNAEGRFQSSASALLLVIVVLTSGSTIGRFTQSDNWISDEKWPCVISEVDSAAADGGVWEVCFPSDQVRDLPEVAERLRPLVDQLYQVDPQLFPLHLSAHPESAMAITMPFGMQHFDADVTALDLVYGTSNCFDGYPDQGLLDSLYVLTLWVHPTLELDPYLYGQLLAAPPTLEQAQVAYAHLRECNS